MRATFLSITALVLAGLGFSEFVMIGAFLGLAVICWFWFTRPVVALIVCLASLGGLALHFQGYKVLGSATVVESAKLVNAHELARLEPPATLRFADGRTETLTGVYFPAAVDLTDPQSGALPHMFYLEDGRPLAVSVSSKGASKRAEYRQRNHYWCGNTFFPTLFPRRLARHKIVDFGKLLVDSGIALPHVESTGEEDYTQELLKVFDRSYSTSLPQIATRIPSGDPVAIALGRKLLGAKDRLFVTGATLLIAAQDRESYEEIRVEILRREQLNRDDYNAVAQARSTSLPHLLAWIDPQFAKEELGKAVSSLSEEHRERISTLEWALHQSLWPVLANGDLAEIDALVIELDDKRSPRRPFYSRVLPELFRWPSSSPYFQQWYWANRWQLNSGRDHSGALAMWLTGGEPFDAQFQHSMKEIAGLE